MKKMMIFLAVLTMLSSLSANSFKKLKMINSGIGGNNSRQGLKRFAKDVLKYKPDTVIIFFGMNDAVNDGNSVSLDEFRKNLTAMVDMARINKITPLLVTIHPVDEKALYRRHKDNLQKFYLSRGGANKILDSYNDIIRALAQEKDVALIDFAKEATSVNLNAGKNIVSSKDGVHLSIAGKQVLGKLIAKILRKDAEAFEKIVCFGDSITYFGYITEVLKELDPERFPIYTTSVASVMPHKDTEPPSLLIDGNYKNIGNQSVQYPDDVEILVDLRKQKTISKIKIIGFNGGNYKLHDISLFVGKEKNNLNKIGFQLIKEKSDRKARIFTFNISQKIRYFKVKVIKTKGAGRILLSEIKIEEERKCNEKCDE